MICNEVTHEESWQIVIRRDDSESWPDLPVGLSRTGAMFRPDRIVISLDRGTRRAVTAVEGQRIKANGELSLLRARTEPYLPAPDWAQEIADNERRALCLGPVQTGVDW